MNQYNQGPPSVGIDFLHFLLMDSDKLVEVYSYGDTMAYVLKGNRSVPAYKKTLYLTKSEDGVVDYDFAVSIAHRIKMLDKLLEHLQEQHNWKDGGYFVK